MAILMQCPSCGEKVELPETAQTATCPKCANTFRAVRTQEADAVSARPLARGVVATRRSYDSDDESEADDSHSSLEGLLPAWISLWGFLAFLLAGLGLMLAPFVMARWLTISFAVLGLASVGMGIAGTAGNRKPKDLSWLAAGGLFSLVLLGVALISPGLLNRYWGMANAVPQTDPHQLIAYSDQPDEKGRALGPDEVVDAVSDAIGQNGMSLRIMSVQMGEVEGRGAKEFLLVRVRVCCLSRQNRLTFEGFGTDKHRPVLKGPSGESYAFLEQRARKIPAGAVVFLAGPPQTVDIQPKRFLEFQLVFEPPPGDFPTLTLELPASTWGRKGAFRYRIDRLFTPFSPVAEKE